MLVIACNLLTLLWHYINIALTRLVYSVDKYNNQLLVLLVHEKKKELQILVTTVQSSPVVLTRLLKYVQANATFGTCDIPPIAPPPPAAAGTTEDSPQNPSQDNTNSAHRNDRPLLLWFVGTILPIALVLW